MATRDNLVLIYAAEILADECQHKRFGRKLRFHFMQVVRDKRRQLMLGSNLEFVEISPRKSKGWGDWCWLASLTGDCATQVAYRLRGCLLRPSRVSSVLANFYASILRPFHLAASYRKKIEIMHAAFCRTPAWFFRSLCSRSTKWEWPRKRVCAFIRSQSPGKDWLKWEQGIYYKNNNVCSVQQLFVMWGWYCRVGTRRPPFADSGVF